MYDILMWAGGIVIAGIVSIIGWVLRMIFGTLKEHKDNHTKLVRNLSEHKLHAAETFVNKVDLRDFIDRIMVKLDKIDEKLDKKADK